MKRELLHRISLIAMAVGGFALPAVAQEEAVTDVHKPDAATIEQVFKKPGYSPYAGRNFPTRVYWGNQHMHTALSLDAGAVGCKLGQEDAYRFARGEEVTTSTGQSIKLSRPMDWLLVSDHAEAMGAINGIVGDDPGLMADPTIKRWHDMIRAGGKDAYNAAWEMIHALSAHKLPLALVDRAFVKTILGKYIEIAEKYNEPGRFTAIIGYEWTSMPGGDNIHRNVLFRDGPDKTSQILPFSALDSENPEDLWKVLAAYEEKTGGQAYYVVAYGNAGPTYMPVSPPQ